MRDPGLQTQVQGSGFGVGLLRSDSVLCCFYCAEGGEYGNIGKLENTYMSVNARVICAFVFGMLMNVHV